MLKVVDENVVVIANDATLLSLNKQPRNPNATDECRLSCIKALETIIAKGRVVVDLGTEFLDKYKAHASFEGQPGVGDAFLRFIYERGYDAAWVTRVKISDDDGYLLPDAFLSSGFDNDDFLWVSAAHNCAKPCQILNACDSDYEEHAAALAALPVGVNELCAA